MRKPDKDYDWDNAIGKGFHVFSGYGMRPSPTPRGVITRKSKSRVYYTGAWSDRESWCPMGGISLVEVTEEQSLAIAKAYAEMNEDIGLAKGAYLKILEDMCE